MQEQPIRNSSPLSQELSDSYSDLDEYSIDETDDYQTAEDETSDCEISGYEISGSSRQEEEDHSNNEEHHIEDTLQSHSQLVKNVLSSSTSTEIAETLAKIDRVSILGIPAKSHQVTQTQVDVAEGEAFENQSLIPQSKLVKHITISWDQTREGEFKTEILQAVLGRPSTSISELEPAKKKDRTGSYPLQDYQMQLMLLEQQNKKRLLLARQEQDSATSDIGTITAQAFAKQARGFYSTSSSSETNTHGMNALLKFPSNKYEFPPASKQIS